MSGKVVLKRLCGSDNREASAHLFRSSGRQSICWQTELYKSLRLYSVDGLIMAA